MLRAPFSLEKMSYEPVSGTVIYRSRLHKTLKRNFQIMSGADWLAQLCRHIPDRFEHLVRYAGWYSNRSRERGTRVPNQLMSPYGWPTCTRAAACLHRAPDSKVYEVDPSNTPSAGL
jgi:hypothetical protein